MSELPQLNRWLLSTLKRAQAICEDSDRKNRSAGMFLELIDRVYLGTVRGAHRAPAPTLERTETEEAVVLSMEWFDKESYWHLYFTVVRRRGEKPVTMLDFYGNPATSACKDPTDADIDKALYDYFQSWKGT